MAGIIAFCSLLPILHLAIGIIIITAPESFPMESPEELPPQVFGYLFAFFGATFFILGEALAIANILSGRFLKLRKRYWFSFVIACINCLYMPFGTILGVFTIIVLSRESVKELYLLPNAEGSKLS